MYITCIYLYIHVYTHNSAGALSAYDIIDKNIRDLKIKFDIDNIHIENHRSPNN